MRCRPMWLQGVFVALLAGIVGSVLLLAALSEPSLRPLFLEYIYIYMCVCVFLCFVLFIYLSIDFFIYLVFFH